MWRFRPGEKAESQIQELEKTIGLPNLRDIPIETAFPEAGPEEASLHIVNSSSTFYLVLLSGGARYRTQLTSF